MTENTTLEKTFEEDIEDVLVEEIASEMSFEQTPEIPSFSLKEAALLLGKSLRSLERSLSGRWGNKLPEGWTATKKLIDGKEEWQITPPQGFRYDHLLDAKKKEDTPVQHIKAEDLLRPLRTHFEMASSREVSSLLRELAATHRELAEQRKLHVQDLRTLLELQNSMRLLEVNAAETSKLRDELVGAQQDLISLRDQYFELANRPWWKRIFRRR